MVRFHHIQVIRSIPHDSPLFPTNYTINQSITKDVPFCPTELSLYCSQECGLIIGTIVTSSICAGDLTNRSLIPSLYASTILFTCGFVLNPW